MVIYITEVVCMYVDDIIIHTTDKEELSKTVNTFYANLVFKKVNELHISLKDKIYIIDRLIENLKS